MRMIDKKMHEQSMVGRIWAKGGNFMHEREESIMIQAKSMQTPWRNIVDLFNTKQTQLKTFKSSNQTLRYTISTKQMQDLNMLYYR